MIDEVLNPLMYEPLQIKSRWKFSVEFPVYTSKHPQLKNIEYLVKSINLPFDKITTETNATGEKIPSKYVYPESISIEIYENKDFNTLVYFKAWKDAIYDPIEKRFKIGDEFQDSGIRQGTLEFYDDHIGPNFSNLSEMALKSKPITVPNKKFELINMKFLGFGDLSLSKEENDFLTYTLNFSVDQVNY